MKIGILPDFAYSQRTPDTREVGRLGWPKAHRRNDDPLDGGTSGEPSIADGTSFPSYSPTAEWRKA